MKNTSQILFEVCTQHEVTISAVRGKSRITELVRARRAAAQVMQTEGYKIAEIARALDRTHGSVHHLLKEKD